MEIQVSAGISDIIADKTLRKKMCGFLGSVGSSENLRLDVARKILQTRGPDSSGLYNDGTLSMIHTRLAIQDLSEKANQPMLSTATSSVFAFNGEIYNVQSLRLELKGLGYKFISNSDTEVILKGYEEWGDKVWGMLDGIFACVLWNWKHKELKFARDPFGIKPLYLRCHPGSVVFSSEISALLAAGITSRFDTRSMGSYRLWGAYTAGETAIKDVISLEPGALFRWSSNDGLIRLYRYKRLDRVPIKRRPSKEQALVKIHNLLSTAVEMQSVGDTQVGCFLSGGLDSGVLAALLQETSNSPCKTITVGFSDEYAFDETDRAERVAKYLGTEHLSVKYDHSDFERLFDEYIDAIDLPSADGFNSFLACRSARLAGLKVAFSGLGADEIFGGYKHFQDFANIQHLKSIPLISKLPAKLLSRIELGSLAFASRGVQATFELRSIPFNGLNSSQKRKLIQQQMSALANCCPNDSLSCLEIATYLRNTLLRDTDAVSMHHGLEVRVPYLSMKLVEYCLSLPPTLHQLSGPKSLLREAFGNRLPTDTCFRSKTGFGLPLGNWMLQSNRFHPSRIQNLLQPAGIGKKYIFGSWLLMRARPQSWQPYWRWVILAETIDRWMLQYPQLKVM